jgi:hypothetical protein
VIGLAMIAGLGQARRAVGYLTTSTGQGA